MVRAWSVLVAGCVVGSAAISGAAAGPDVTAEEYALYVDWKSGVEDPRLAKDNDDGKLAKIAKSLKVKPAVLRAAIAKVEPLAATLAKDTGAAVRQELESTVLRGRVLEVVVDDTQEHVVVYVKWRCGDARDVDKEASFAAFAAGDAARYAKTVGLWCTDGADVKQFSATVAASAAVRIDKTAIERFASSRYIKLFEDVKRGPHK